ncbi:MAG TPA: hypothetical protein VGD41_18025, partial [Pyrinomonadaceae bacterium]
MPDSGVIQEFLVGIGFKTDQASFNVAKKLLNDLQGFVDKVTASLDKANASLTSLSNNQAIVKTVQGLNDNFKELTDNITASDKAAAGFSGTMDKNVDRSVRGFQDS